MQIFFILPIYLPYFFRTVTGNKQFIFLDLTKQMTTRLVVQHFTLGTISVFGAQQVHLYTSIEFMFCVVIALSEEADDTCGY